MCFAFTECLQSTSFIVILVLPQHSAALNHCVIRQDARVSPYCTPRVPRSSCNRLAAGHHAIVPAVQPGSTPGTTIDKCHMQVYCSCMVAQMQVVTMHCSSTTHDSCFNNRGRLSDDHMQEFEVRAGSAEAQKRGSPQAQKQQSYTFALPGK